MVISAKQLHQMNPEELGPLFPIILSDYDSAWSACYEHQSTLILQQLVQDYQYGREAYTNVKTDFIEQASKQARLYGRS